MKKIFFIEFLQMIIFISFVQSQTLPSQHFQTSISYLAHIENIVLQNTAHVLDSILEWDFDTQSSTYIPTFRHVVMARTPGAPQVPALMETSKFIKMFHQWRKWKSTYTEYFQPATEKKLKILFVRPWNQNTLSWDDTLEYVHMTGQRNHSLDLDIFTKYIYREYDFVSSQFLDGRKLILTLLSDTLPSEMIELLYDAQSNTYKNSKIYTISYNSYNLPAELHENVYDNNTGQWVFFIRYFIQYYANHQKYQVLQQVWQNNQWFNQKKTTYYYNALSLLEEERIEQWDQQLQTWLYDTKVLYTYTQTNNVATESGYVWNGTAWRPDYRHEYEYDGSGHVTQLTVYTNDAVNFVPFSRNIYQYDSQGRLIDIIEQSWNGSAFLNTHRTNYIYNYDFLTAEVYYYWSQTYTSWLWAYKTEYNYDLMHGVLMSREFYTYDTNNSVWVPIDKTQYFYSDIDVTRLNELKDINIEIYPNPVVRDLYIFVDDPIKYQKLVITNLHGQVVYSTNEIHKKQRVDISALQQGIYVCNLETKFGPKISKQFVIAR